MARLTFAANFMRNRIQCLNEEFTISICWNSFSMTSSQPEELPLEFCEPEFWHLSFNSEDRFIPRKYYICFSPRILLLFNVQMNQNVKFAVYKLYIFDI